MKKIFILPILFLALLSCSKSNNDEIATNTTPAELIGTWKLVGYYDDIEDPATNSNYHLITNGGILKFDVDGKFDDVGDAINPDGSYSVSSDLVITMNFYTNSSNPNSVFKDKITLLTNNVLEFGNYQATMADTYRYEKINMILPISGKK